MPADSSKPASNKRDTIASLRSSLRRSEFLLNLTRRVATIEKLDDLLVTLVEVISSELNAERGTLFLNDPATSELYSRVAQGTFNREIRIHNNVGIAGHVFQSGKGEIVPDVRSDPRFNKETDQITGFVTQSILAAPVVTAGGDVIGVVQALNKRSGSFTHEDLDMLAAIATQACVALQSSQYVEKLVKTRKQEMEFLDLVADITSSLDLSVLLRRVMGEAARMLKAERSTLFLNNEKTNELISEVGQGVEKVQIRLPNHLGIAGAVFTSNETINIPHAYADLRFNPAFDKKTGFFTRSILCVPVVNKNGKVIGVTQALNKRGGPFTEEDESRLRAFTAQVSIALENAKLFDDVQNMKNYNESVLQSMSSGVVTLNEDGLVQTCNSAGYRIFQLDEEMVINQPAKEIFAANNEWINERIAKSADTTDPDIIMDGEVVFGGEKLNVNLTIQPLINLKGKRLGTMLMIEDISSEKRMKSTMSRYIDPALTDQLLASGGDLLGGQSMEATVLFSDIRSFTSLTEELGAQGTVALLNEYFTVMVNCITNEGGMLDKFIGDALMAEFGIPVAHEDDPDRAIRAAIDMIHALDTLNELRLSRGQKPINMGIGLNTDMIVSGNIGSPKRMDYTVIGDGVNLASRLESACKEYSARILASEATIKKLKGSYRMREVDLMVVKGKSEPVRVYEILDYHSEATFPNLPEVMGHFKAGFKYYLKGDFDRASKQFNEALTLNPADQLSATYIERCKNLIANPPEGEWNGIHVMKSK